ncbi:hypothetical protein D9758_008594 [Tetrapyrgos nigripes]|uniref:GST N-terminal domain-containing protein n=1 Tax=Tetrapyrgos nigripes TaxID=182062 RepID=A0A8H5G5G4_9AGAR|nr:hypothetical protein D9758_008594 [Tetrapyrgos nigripes]
MKFSSLLTTFVLLVPSVTFCIGSGVAATSLYTDPNDLPTKEYDFIVVGAGTAGNVIAARLSEDPTKSVLVIEAGVDDTNVLPIHVPFLAFNNYGSGVDWNYTTVPQKELNNRTVFVPRGFTLGGSSSINVMIWTRGSRDLWDHYSKVTGDSGWGWDALEKYWNRISTYVPPTSNPSPLAIPPPNDPTLSNGNGPVLVTLSNFPGELDGKVINASKLLQQENGADSRFKYTADMNTGDSLGFGYNQQITGHGERYSSATAYLHPALNSHRPNLDVLIQTRATRLLQSWNDTSDIPHFNQVEVAQSVDGPRFKFSARNEIILSSGAIGTPQLLLLSGVGPKEELEGLGIDVVADRPAVGKNLREHPLLLTIYEVNSTKTFDDAIRIPALQQQLLEQWENNRTGLFANSVNSVLGFLRLPDDQLEGTQDSASGPNAPHLELLYADGFLPVLGTQPATGNYITVANVVVAPKSVGSLTLKSTDGDTFTQPLIDYNIYGDSFDVQAMLQAVNDSETFFSTAPWTEDNLIISLAGRNSTSIGATEEEKIAFLKDNTVTIFHPVGTASMGSKDEDVTDARLRVRGLKGVRIVDASVFVGPWSPNTWKTRYSLNFKGLPFKVIWVEYPDIEPTLKAAGIAPFTTRKDGSPYYSLPAIYDPKTGTGLTESFAIAEYLDKTYPDTPQLIPPGTRALQKAFVATFWDSKVPSEDQFVIPKTTWILNPSSEEYFRRTRLVWYKMTMEEMYPEGAKKESEWRKLETELGQMAKVLKDGIFVMGDQISFADLALAGNVNWFRILYGKDSTEWQDMASWHDGRWGKLVTALERYE